MKLRVLLQRLAILSLLFALLGAQLGWLVHEHQAHDNGQQCEECVTAAQLGHGLAVLAPPSAPLSSWKSEAPRLVAPASLLDTYHYSQRQRAPPHHS